MPKDHRINWIVLLVWAATGFPFGGPIGSIIAAGLYLVMLKILIPIFEGFIENEQRKRGGGRRR